MTRQGVHRITPLVALGLWYLGLVSPAVHAASPSAPFTPLSQASAPPAGDWVNSSTSPGLNTHYTFFAEVMPGTSQLTLDVFDADLGVSLATEPLRDNRGTGAVTGTYEIFSPAGVLRARLIVAKANSTAGHAHTVTWEVRNPTDADPLTVQTPPTAVSLDDAWFSMFTIANPTPGHWEIRDRLTGAAGSHNCVSFRVHDGNPGPGGAEINMYATVHANMGSLGGAAAPNQARYQHTFHPYVTSGCECNSNDHDLDSNSGGNPNGSLSINTRARVDAGDPALATFGNAALSVNGGWNTETVNIPAAFDRAFDYGLYTVNTAVNTIPNTNNVGWYFSNELDSTPTYTAGSAPAVNPNAFRIYFPTDAGTRPLKPWVGHSLDTPTGSINNPLVQNQVTRVRVTISVVNPTPHPITFSTPSNLVRSLIPNGAPHNIQYKGVSVITQGSVVTQPALDAINPNSNIEWNPGVVAGTVDPLNPTVARLRYDLDVTITTVGGTVTLTGDVAGGTGTRATHVDETGNTVQAQATYTHGPLCPMSVTAAGDALFVELDWLRAAWIEAGTSVRVEWQTAVELDNAGFRIVAARVDELGNLAPAEILTPDLIAPLAQDGMGAYYTHDVTLATGAPAPVAIYLADMDLSGVITYHGPMLLEPIGGDARNTVTNWQNFN